MLRFLAGLLLALAAAAVPAAEPAAVQDLLARTMNSAKTLNYEGNLVYVHGGNVSNLRITHVRDGDQEWEHLLKVDGRGAEVLRGGNDVIYRSAHGRATRLSLNSLPAMARPQALGEHLEGLGQSYDGSVSEGTRIAGREAELLRLTPHDQDRYGFEFYVDKATGLLLKSLMLDENGKPLEAVSFTSIRIGPDVGLAEFRAARRNPPPLSPHSKPVRAATPASSGSSHPAPPPVPAEPAALDWQLWMPSGFTPLGPVRKRLINGVPVVIATYSDGLSSFSFFSERVNPARLPAAEQHQRGATAFVSRQRSQGDKAWLISVVGELPLAIAEHIADSAAPTAP